jgi:diadenosine tetraphosphate (Ap4A) HIT family hydrolase
LDDRVWYQCCFYDFDSETIWDGFPTSKGHTLVVPEFHIPSFHDLGSETQVGIWELVSEIRNRLKDCGGE